MGKHRNLIVVASLVIALWCATGVRAEVSAELDLEGNYLQMIITSNASVKKLKLWTVQRAREDVVPLNPDGDLTGDLWPAMIENPLHFNHPWVLWSRFNGTDYDLAWSRWLDQGAWSPIQWLEISPGVVGDDLDPSLALDGDGRPFTTWWRDESGVGRVYLSIFLATRWMVAYPVSDVGEDSRYPSIQVQDGQRIVVTYSTPQGEVSRVVHFKRPDTITDDLNPFEGNTLLTETGSGESEELSQ